MATRHEFEHPDGSRKHLKNLQLNAIIFYNIWTLKWSGNLIVSHSKFNCELEGMPTTDKLPN